MNNNTIKDAFIITLVLCFICVYLESVYPQATIPVAIIYYILWVRFLVKYETKNQGESYDNLLKLCEKPKGRWDYDR